MKSQLNFLNFLVTHFAFEKTTDNKEDQKFEIHPQAVISRKTQQFHINIEVDIIDNDHNFILKMLCAGVFKYDTEEEGMLLNFMSVNGPAIIFPYIRSFVSNFTSLSGFDTITLPTLNLAHHKSNIIDELIDMDSME